MKVESKQGTTESLNVMLDCGHKEQPEANLRMIADQLRVKLEDLGDVIENWSKADLCAHCKKMDAEALKPPAMRGKGAPAAKVKKAKRGKS